MSISRFRLPDKADRLYSGQMLDRSRSVRFTLDDHVYEAFHGDTVLSALLANGVDEFGQYRGEPVGLDERLHPPVTYADTMDDPTAAMAMSRVPAIDGMELVSLAELDVESAGMSQRLGRTLRRLRGRIPTSLSLDPESISPFPGPWTELDPVHRMSADLVVVGGGAGGLAAARAGAERGWSVLLVEQLAVLGGDATFFGSEEGDARASELVDDLVAELRAAPRVEILTDTEVLGFSGGTLRAHQTMIGDDRTSARVISLKGDRVVLAPGAHERLPLFSGNRLPGVSGARAAHRLAANYGVWRGGNAIINTASSAATQVALQAADLGVDILKLTDSRDEPHSNFFEFAKAYGVLLATGLRVSLAEVTENRQLAVRFELTGSGKSTANESATTDRLLICGGWQSDLTLWNMAGGTAAWDRQRQQLRATGDLENVALAGWCRGGTGISSCIASGEEAVLKLAGGRYSGRETNSDGHKLESDDGALPIARPRLESPACYLDNGYSFSTLEPAGNKRGLLAKVLGLGEREAALELRTLSLNDVSAKVILGEITPEVAGDFAKERCVPPGRIETTGGPAYRPETDAGYLELPAFLSGRFGADAQVVELLPAGGQGVEVGCLIFQSSVERHPEQAIGVVLDITSSAQGGARALLRLDQARNSGRYVARMSGRVVDLHLAEQSAGG